MADSTSNAQPADQATRDMQKQKRANSTVKGRNPSGRRASYTEQKIVEEHAADQAKTWKYIGIGAAVLAVGAILYLVLKKRRKK